MPDWKAIRERQEAKAAARVASIKAAEKEARKQRRERAYLEAITGGHDHSMDA